MTTPEPGAPPAPEPEPRVGRGTLVAIVVAVVVGVAVVVALLVAGRGGQESSTPAVASAEPSAVPSPTPTPDSVVWAGQVCTDIERVTGSVSSLGRNLDYDLRAEASALEQIQRQLTVQVLAVGDAVDRLTGTLTAVPVDFVAATDFANGLATSGADTREAVEAVRTHLTAATEASDVLTVLAELGQAVIAGKAAYEAGSAFVGLLGDATSTASGQLREAFDAAPACAPLTGASGA